MRSLRWSAVVGLVVMGCGGGSEPDPAPRPVATSGSERRRVEPQDGLQIEGLMGTISQMQVQGTLQPRTADLATCFAQGADVEVIGGEIRLSFRIRVDGTVLWVYPSNSTIGHRAVERCIVERAATVQFPRPRGGEAEFSWGFAYDPPSDLRAPLSWDGTHVATALEAHGEALRSSCGAVLGARVTAYVGRGGRALAVGASVEDQASAAQLDCITEGVRAWTFPDPGSYPAKAIFTL